MHDMLMPITALLPAYDGNAVRRDIYEQHGIENASSDDLRK